MKRQKANKKTLRFFERIHAIKPPYKILLTAEFVNQCLSKHSDFMKGIKDTLKAAAYPYITSCQHSALIKGPLGKQFNARPPKDMQIIPCQSKRHGLLACIQNAIGPGNSERFVVMAQDPEARRPLAQLPGIPIIFINYNVYILENISQASLQLEKQIMAEKLQTPKNVFLLAKKLRTGQLLIPNEHKHAPPPSSETKQHAAAGAAASEAKSASLNKKARSIQKDKPKEITAAKRHLNPPQAKKPDQKRLPEKRKQNEALESQSSKKPDQKRLPEKRKQNEALESQSSKKCGLQAHATPNNNPAKKQNVGAESIPPQQKKKRSHSSYKKKKRIEEAKNSDLQTNTV